MPSGVRRCSLCASSRGFATTWNLRRHVVRVHGADCNRGVIRSVSTEELHRLRIHFGVTDSSELESTLPVGDRRRRRQRQPRRPPTSPAAPSVKTVDFSSRPARMRALNENEADPGNSVSTTSTSTSLPIVVFAPVVDGRTTITSPGESADRSLGSSSALWRDLDAIAVISSATCSPLRAGLGIDFGDSLLAAAAGSLATPPCPIGRSTPDRVYVPLKCRVATPPFSITDLPPIGEDRSPSAVEVAQLEAVRVLPPSPFRSLLTAGGYVDRDVENVSMDDDPPLNTTPLLDERNSADDHDTGAVAQPTVAIRWIPHNLGAVVVSQNTRALPASTCSG